ncbi:MAG: hypothetical protein WB506_11425 [Candidatus Sulfotelmatobacter sp.]
MNRLLLIAFAVLLAAVISTSPAVAQQRNPDAPNYEISFPKYQYPATVSSLQEVDFKSLTVFWFGKDGPRRNVKLVNGGYDKDDEYHGGEYITLDLLRFLDASEEDAKYAVVDIDWRSCGGSCSESGLAQVFNVQSGYPTVVEQIRYERHAPNTGASIDAAAKTLTLTGRSSEPSANCCPKSLDVMTFTWNGKEFTFADRQRVVVRDNP